MKVCDVKQGTPEWIAMRLGKVTASEIDALVSPLGKIRTGQGPNAYLCRKVAEKVLGWAQDDVSTFAMQQGSMIEHQAIPFLELIEDLKIDRAGFCVTDDERCGFSPDGLIGEDGGVEVKAPQPATMVEYILEGGVPECYKMQIQFSLWVSKRKWWKFFAFSLQLPPILVHVDPDPFIQDQIGAAIAQFNAKFDVAEAKIRALRDGDLANRNTGSRD